MISNYYTLLAIIRTLRARHTGWTAETPFTQRRNELVVPLRSPDGDASASLVISCEPSANFLAVRNTISRAARNSADIFPDLNGQTAKEFDLHPSDRVAAILFSSGHAVLCQLFGSRSNVYCIPPGDEAAESFLRSRQTGVEASYPFVPESPLSIEEAMRAARGQADSMSVEKLIRRTFPTLGPVLVRELLFRSSIDPASLTGDLPEASVKELTRSLPLFLDELRERPSPRIVRCGDEAHFSLIPLHHLETCEEDRQESISAGIFRYLSTQKRQDSFLSLKKDVLRSLESAVEKARAAVGAVSKALMEDDEIEQLERSGKIIQLHLTDIEKGMRSLEVTDPFETAPVTRTIGLDPSISPVKNAERYFDKAKHARSRKDDAQKRKREAERRLKELAALQREAEEITDIQSLRTFANVHRGDVTLPAAVTGKAEPPPPFRIYVVEGGFQVWVGKNSANNDLLTTRHTGKNDLWFHARGVGGSHVVLKAGTGKGEIPKQAKVSAAAIAAYYSKMKNARHVAVSMCLGKFVRKPRKAPPGTVTIEREEVIFADPSIPGDEKEG